MFMVCGRLFVCQGRVICDRSSISGEVDMDCIGCPKPAFARRATFASTHATSTMTLGLSLRVVFPKVPAHDT